MKSTNLNETEYDRNYWILLLTSIPLWGIFGNGLVCLAILSERRLQNITNYFLCSLAIADLLVCAFVMPLAIITEINAGFWIYSIGLCNVFVWSDIVLCSASIIHMSTISLDRYLGIARPFKARNASSSTLVLKILAVWCCSFAFSLPMLILGWRNPENIYADGFCQVSNTAFQIYGSSITFLIPCIIFCVTFVLTVKLLNQQARQCAQGSSQSSSPDHRIALRRSIVRKSPEKRGKASVVSVVDGRTKVTLKETKSKSLCERDNINVLKRQETALDETAPATPTTPAKSPAKLRRHRTLDSEETLVSDSMSLKRATAKDRMKRVFRFQRRSQELANEQKATKVLGIVFFSFLVCWVPFFTTNIVLAMCQPCALNFPRLAGNIFLWLGYMSSTINPLIYTAFNQSFRRCFLRIITCNRFGLEQPRGSIFTGGGTSAAGNTNNEIRHKLTLNSDNCGEPDASTPLTTHCSK